MNDSLLCVESVEISFCQEAQPHQIKIEQLAIRPGDRFLLTGPSGSGKSTLMAFLAGISMQHIRVHTHGYLKLLDADYSRVALVQQNPWSQFVAPTVEKELAFALENQALDPQLIRLKVKKALEDYDLTLLASRKPWTLSGGECQRVAVACALIQNPRLIFFDEAFSCLDSQNVTQIFSLLDKLSPSTALLVIDHKPWIWKDRVHQAFELVQEISGIWNLQPCKMAASRPFFFRPRCQTPSQPLLSLQGLTAGYQKTHPVLKDVNLELYPGTITTVEGPSGCGKTTLLKCLTGGLKPWAGQFYPRKTRNLVWVSQNPEHFFLYHRVEKEWLGAESRAQEYKLFHLAKRSPYTLSEGEKRRLNLVAAMALKRPIILLDEPGFGLDQQSLDILLHDLDHLRSQGIAFLIISHDEEFCQEITDRRLFLSHGRLNSESFIAQKVQI